MIKPKITSVTMLRNGTATIALCLQSVSAQNYANLECIVRGGASDDGTQRLIGPFEEYITYYPSVTDDDGYDAPTQASSRATGDIVGLFDANDWLALNAPGVLAAMWRSAPDSELFCFGLQECVLAADQEILHSRAWHDPDSPLFQLQDGLYCHCLNRFYARSIIKHEEYFNTALYSSLADREFYVRRDERRLKKIFSPKILYYFLVHAGSITTGGNAAKKTLFIGDTARIARNRLQRKGFSPAERLQLADKYCFNVLRAIWFTARSGNGFSALEAIVRRFIRYPLRRVRNIVFWRMPDAYRSTRML